MKPAILSQKEPVLPDSAVDEAKAFILAQLMADDMRLYEMYCTEILPAHEIAAKLGISYAAAITRIKRFKIKVRILIKKYFS